MIITEQRVRAATILLLHLIVYFNHNLMSMVRLL